MKKLIKWVVFISITILSFNTTEAQQITYKKDRADLHESLKITKIGKTKIKFEIIMTSGGCEDFKLSGTATLKTASANDVDDKDTAFKAASYEAVINNINVTIKLGTQKGFTNRARINWLDTKSEDDPCKTESESLIKTK